MAENNNSAKKEPRYNLLGHSEKIQVLLMKHIAEKDLENLLKIPQMKKTFDKYEGEFPPPSEFSDDTVMTFVCNDDLFYMGITRQSRRSTRLVNPSAQTLQRYLKGAQFLHIELKNKVPEYFKVDHENYEKLKNGLKGYRNIRIVRIITQGVLAPFDIACLFTASRTLLLHPVGRDLQMPSPDFFNLKPNTLSVESHTMSNEMKQMILDNMKIEDLRMESDEPLSLDAVIQEWQQGQRDIGSIQITFSAHVRHRLVNAKYVRKNASGLDEKVTLTTSCWNNKKICNLRDSRY